MVFVTKCVVCSEHWIRGTIIINHWSSFNLVRGSRFQKEKKQICKCCFNLESVSFPHTHEKYLCQMLPSA